MSCVKINTKEIGFVLFCTTHNADDIDFRKYRVTRNFCSLLEFLEGRLCSHKKVEQEREKNEEESKLEDQDVKR